MMSAPSVSNKENSNLPSVDVLLQKKTPHTGTLRAPLQAVHANTSPTSLRRSTSSLTARKPMSSIPRLHRSASMRSVRSKDSLPKTDDPKQVDTKKKIEEDLKEVAALVKVLHLEKEDAQRKCSKWQRLKVDNEKITKQTRQQLVSLRHDNDHLSQAVEEKNNELTDIIQKNADAHKKLKETTGKWQSLKKQCEKMSSELEKMEQQRQSRCEKSTCTDPTEDVVRELQAKWMVQLEAVEAVEAELAVSETHCKGLQEELVAYSTVQEQLSLSQQREATFTEEVDTLNALLKATREEAASQKDSYELQLQNMQHTVDCRQQDVDEVTQDRDKLTAEQSRLCTVLADHRVMIASLQKDLDASREVERQKNLLQDQIQVLQSGATEAEEFLQLEQAALREEIRELQLALDATRLELSRCQSDRDAAHQASDQLQLHMQQTMAELNHTKVQAHHLLLQQSSEITSSIVALARLDSRLTSLSDSLDKHTQLVPQPDHFDNHQTQEDCESEDHTYCLTSQAESTSDSESAAQSDLPPAPTQSLSLVSSVLRAIEGLDELQKDTVPSSNQVAAAESHDQAIAPVIGEPECESSVTEAPDSDSMRASAFTRIQPESASQAETEPKEEKALYEQIETLYVLVGDIMGKMKVIDQGMQITCSKMHQQIETLQTKLETEQLSHKRQQRCSTDTISDLQQEVRDLVKQERHLQATLSSVRQEAADKDANLAYVRGLLQEKTQSLAAMNDERQQFKKWKKEVSRLTMAGTEREAEKKALQESLNLALARLDSVPGHEGTSLSQQLRENCFLKTEIGRLKTRALEKQDESDRQTGKLTKHNQILRDNCEKAENELVTLDQLVERLTQVIKEHGEEVKQWPEAEQIQLELACQL